MPRKTTGPATSSRRKTAKSAQVAAIPSFEAPKNGEPVNLEDQIRRRAYEIYLERGGAPGDEHADWLTAEREVRGMATAAGVHG